ncbi:TadE/TadG family type IV pilus assembly protein [Bradyrhizobium sp. 2TAF24]|uniref:TadE/TadG family type IV pilus assembly protein n=1 Tax=Bradyrhizobium sp. 2TAF24 TaxID=3233011 RepID=UPI003F8F4F13
MARSSGWPWRRARIAPGPHRQRLARFVRTERGATAVEFAIVAPIFIGLLISVLQTGIFFFAQETLQAAAMQSGRLLMTGQAQSSNMTQTQFINQVCPSVQALFNCSQLMVDVQSYTSFSGANTGSPTLTYNAQGQVTNNWAFSPGTQGQVVVLRLMYQWPLIGGPFQLILPNLSNGTALMMGVAAFRVEPY